MDRFSAIGGRILVQRYGTWLERQGRKHSRHAIRLPGEVGVLYTEPLISFDGKSSSRQRRPPLAQAFGRALASCSTMHDLSSMTVDRFCYPQRPDLTCPISFTSMAVAASGRRIEVDSSGLIPNTGFHQSGRSQS